MGLPWKITETELKEYFEQFGEVAMTQIKREAASGKSKGYGFIKFKEFEVRGLLLSIALTSVGRFHYVYISLYRRPRIKYVFKEVGILAANLY